MRVGSLFTGIGGFDLGFERAGMEIAWQCEADKACRKLLMAKWPAATLIPDVREIGWDVGTADLICGGFPCQDVSVAGRRAGLAGERSGLWFEFHRILATLRPLWVVIENVPGLLSSNSGRDFAAILHGLVELGYGVCWRILDSQYLRVAQRRRRLFVVGSLGTGRAAQVLFEREGLPRGAEKGGQARQGSAAAPEGVAGTVSSKWAKGTGGPAGDECYNIVTPTLRASQGGVRTGTDALVYSIQGNTIDRHAVAGTIAASGAGTSRAAGNCNELDFLIPHGRYVRRLTPTECERLQGFPDGWTAGFSDSTRYKMLGNAVTVNVAEWIGKRILREFAGVGL